jgi:tungstate transport system ATP-binding protein
MKPLITVKNLSKVYDGKRVLESLSFEVLKGERAVVIGPNGAGKTTLIRILNRLETPSGGDIYFNGKNVQNIKEKWRMRRKMAVVFQRPAVLNSSVYGNIAAGLRIRGEKKANIDEKIKDVLKSLGIIRLLRKNAKGLSGGEKQLLALARAIILKPKLLLLDEPSSNLDPENSALVWDVIKNTESTVIITSPTKKVPFSASRVIYMVDRRRTLIK